MERIRNSPPQRPLSETLTPMEIQQKRRQEAQGIREGFSALEKIPEGPDRKEVQKLLQFRLQRHGEGSVKPASVGLGNGQRHTSQRSANK